MNRIKSRQIKTSELTSECWGVQMWGLEKCNNCEFKDTDECGGQNIRKTGMNVKGFTVPIGEDMETTGDS